MSVTQILIAGHLGLGSVALSTALVRAAFRRELDFLFLLLVIFGTFYGFAAAGLHLATLFDWDHRWSYEVSDRASAYGPALAIVFLAFLSLGAGWFVGSRCRFRSVILRSHRRREPAGVLVLQSHRIRWLAWLLLGISAACMYVHTRAYGGFVSALELAPAVRAGLVEVVNPWSFLRPLGGFSLFSAFLFLGLLHARGGRRSVGVWIGLVLATVVAGYVLLSWGGRLNVAVFVTVFLLTSTIIGGRAWLLTRAAAAAGAASLILFFGYPLLSGARQFLRTGIWEVNVTHPSALRFALDELGFPLVSIAESSRAVYEGSVGLRYFSDVPMALAYMLPEQWTALRAARPILSEVHTSQVDAVLAGGSIPPDMISVGIYSLGIAGVVVACLFVGTAAAWLERFLRRLRPLPVGAVVRLATGLSLATAFVYADPTFILRNNLYLIAGIALLSAIAVVESDHAADRGS